MKGKNLLCFVFLGRDKTMNYIMRYEYDNFDEVFEATPALRHGACFSMFDCSVCFYQLKEPQIVFWIDGSKFSKEEANKIFDFVPKILTYLFAIPIHTRISYIYESEQVICPNNSLSQKYLQNLMFLESKIRKFKSTKSFFDEMLGLLSVAFDNLYNRRDEDAFLYFFKTVERIAKNNYLIYIQRHHNKSATKSNKNKLKRIIRDYALNYLKVELTEDMLDRKIDLLYRDLKLEFYGSVFDKISLFTTINNFSYEKNKIAQLVKVRNKIAHGDIIDENLLNECLANCEYLSMQMFSLYFFRRKYEDIHICSYRYLKGEDFYK